VVEETRRTRSLTAADRALVQVRWLSHLRLLLWFEGGGVVVCVALAVRTNPTWLFIFLAALFGITSWISSRNLERINGDLNNGIAEEIVGSVQKQEKGVFDVAASMFGPVGHFTLALGRFLWQCLGKGSVGLQVLVGVSIMLVAPHLSETIRVDRDTYVSLGDSELVKASVLPQSKVAISVRHVSIAGD